ncbi:MAG: FHA domain-containing protein [Anaerolineales bacterium]|nr:FHA domain-containing protein [Anaerolineales bacterium]
MIIVTTTGERYKLRAGQNRIGRGSDCDLQVESSDASRHHAIISWEAEAARIMDLGSTNGTSVNGARLEAYEYFPLKAGDSIVLGNGEAAERLGVEAEATSGVEAAAATVVMNVKDILSSTPKDGQVSAEMVAKAYEALASGDTNRIKEYWDEEIAWLIPGRNPLSGWHRGLDAFIDYLKRVSALTSNNIKTQPVALTVGDGYSASISKVVGYRAGFNENNAQKPNTMLDVELVQTLRWQNGKIIEGRSALFGEGAYEYDQFWS